MGRRVSTTHINSDIACTTSKAPDIASLLVNDLKSHDETYLSDLAPMTLASEASVTELNDFILSGEDVPINRFRSNIVISVNQDLAFIEGKPAMDESTQLQQCLDLDEIGSMSIGNLHLRAIGPTMRCVIPTVDQESGTFEVLLKQDPSYVMCHR